MPAFTHLCKKFNISLAHNTLTMYPKKTGEKGLAAVMDQCLKLIGLEFVDVEYNLEPIDIATFDEIGRPTFVHRNDSDHALYHDDSFNMDDTHYHMKFPRKLDENALDKIFSIFVTFDIVTSDEKLSFLDAYKQATVVEPEAFKTKESAQNSEPIFSSDQRSTATVESIASVKKQSPHTPTYTEAENKFLTELEAIKVKTDKLRQQADHDPVKYLKAAKTAEALYKKLSDAADAYFDNKNADTYTVFKDKCKDAIDKSRSVLEVHRGWKNVLCNVGAAILGLGVFYIVAASVNYYKTQGKHFFFQFNTDSVNKMNGFQEAVAMAAPAA